MVTGLAVHIATFVYVAMVTTVDSLTSQTPLLWIPLLTVWRHRPRCYGNHCWRSDITAVDSLTSPLLTVWHHLAKLLMSQRSYKSHLQSQWNITHRSPTALKTLQYSLSSRSSRLVTVWNDAVDSASERRLWGSKTVTVSVQRHSPDPVLQVLCSTVICSTVVWWLTYPV